MELFYTPGMTLAEVEKKVILYAYEFQRKNKARTAQTLGVSAKTIYTKLKEYGVIEDENEKAEHTGDQDQSDRKTGQQGDANPI